MAIKACGISKIYRYRGLISSLFSGSFRSEVVALKDFSFEVKRGEIVGIIGSNGSGKSTLMKVLSGVTTPTSGTAMVNGKLFAAIEVTGGFNPDLTGYNNLLLTAKIWGFSNDFVRKHLPEIIEFSGLQGFIHLPVKKYSSGMVSRLASSLIVHTDADVILLDEVLNGSDQGFRRKMHQKIIDENKKGKTIVISSHNLNDIMALCNRVVLINHGKKIFEGNQFKALELYHGLRESQSEISHSGSEEYTNSFFTVDRIKTTDQERHVHLRIRIRRNTEGSEDIQTALIIINSNNNPIAHIVSDLKSDLMGQDIVMHISKDIFSRGMYYMNFLVFDTSDRWMMIPRIAGFNHVGLPEAQTVLPGIQIQGNGWQRDI